MDRAKKKKRKKDALKNVGIKHIKNFSIKNFGPPMTPPPPKFFMLGFLYFEGKGGPKHKEFTGSGVLRGGGSRRGFPAKFLMFIMPFFRVRIFKICYRS